MKVVVVLGMLVMAVLADYGWANGQYITLLSGFSYVGWTLVFVLLYLLFRNFWRTLGIILIFSAVHDFFYNLLHAINGHYALIPMVADHPEKIYGFFAAPLGWIWFGIKSIYFIFPVMGIALLWLTRGHKSSGWLTGKDVRRQHGFKN